MDSNNHFSWFYKLPSDFFSIYKSMYVLIDMRWCLYLKSNQNNLEWVKLVLIALGPKELIDKH